LISLSGRSGGSPVSAYNSVTVSYQKLRIINYISNCYEVWLPAGVLIGVFHWADRRAVQRSLLRPTVYLNDTIFACSSRGRP